MQTTTTAISAVMQAQCRKEENKSQIDQGQQQARAGAGLSPSATRTPVLHRATTDQRTRKPQAPRPTKLNAVSGKARQRVYNVKAKTKQRLWQSGGDNGHSLLH